MKKHYKIQNEPLNEPIEIKIVLEKRKYTDPKLYVPKEIIGKKRPSIKPGKRWCVWFLWLNPNTDKYDINVKFSEGINRLKIVRERKDVGNAVKEAVSLSLGSEWIPPNVRDVVKIKPMKKSRSVREALHYAYEL
ncbi:hypothetical protein [Christiangramia portivictoriae]|uniref:hypothetical protein n=1 Tax=Christiangramia portivictoriae TaxID=326069 RepID=UPI00047E2181|nr:hypothetical protein [Christiangramia portivictoriae]